MKKKVTIVKAPLVKAKEGMSVDSGTIPGQGSVLAPGTYFPVGEDSKKQIEVNTTIKPTSREHANLEAEKGETVVTDLNKDGIPEFYTIGGKPHSQGGTPLNLPPDSFIFSKDKKLKVKDEELLEGFGKNPGKGKKGFTPAELSKTYDLNKYRQILADPDSDRLQRDTAEMMIQNYNLKLGKLAVVQESKKGFDRGIPGIAMPYLESVGIDPESLVAPPKTDETSQEMPAQAPEQLPEMEVGRYGGAPNAEAIKQIEPSSNVKYYQGGGEIPWIGESYRDYAKRVGSGINTNVRGVRWNGEYWADRRGNPVFGAPTAPSTPFIPGGGVIPPGTPGGAIFEPETSSKSTNYYNIPDDATVHDASSENYDESKVALNDYIKDANGKYYKVTGVKEGEPFTGTYGGSDRLVSAAGDAADKWTQAYSRLDDLLQDKEIQDALWEKHKQVLSEAKAKGILSQGDLDAAKKMTKEQVINNYLRMEEQVMAVNAQGITTGAEFDKEDSWDTDRSNYEKTVKDLGYNPLSISEAAAFQGTHEALARLKKEGKFKKLENFNIENRGRADEEGMSSKDISPVDGWVGNTTIGQSAIYEPTKRQITKEEADKKDLPKKPLKPFQPVYDNAPAPFWLQDKIATAGALRDKMGVKKYMPWQATPTTYLPNPTFEDPTRALAATAEMANIATQGAGVFGGPQAYNARAAQIQGAAAKNAADILAQVNQRNVQTANQFELAKTDILNRASDRNASLSTQLYDKNTIANQQFDNAKNQARQQLRQNFIGAVTNRAQTQAMNALYPQYYVDPRTGGTMHHTGVQRRLSPTQQQSKGVSNAALAMKRSNPEMTYDEALKYAKTNAGMPTGYPSNINPAQFAYPGAMPQMPMNPYGAQPNPYQPYNPYGPYGPRGPYNPGRGPMV